jgi:hypothetical protein
MSCQSAQVPQHEEHGSLPTTGGASEYRMRTASNRPFLIQIGEPGA